MRIWTSPFVLGFTLFSALSYGALFIPSRSGYGYAGYGGFNRGPSFFYFGGAPTYHGASVRRGSRYGPGMHGGGMHGGK